MINAQITNAVLGITQTQVPFAQFEFQYLKEGETTPSKAATSPVFLFNPDTETLDNSSMARSLATLFMIAGTPVWNDIVGKVVRIEVNEKGIVTNLQNALSDLYITLALTKEDDVPAASDSEEVPVTAD